MAANQQKIYHEINTIKCNLHFLQIEIISIRFTAFIGKNLVFNDHHKEVMLLPTKATRTIWCHNVMWVFSG